MKSSISARGKDTWRIRVSLGINEDGKRVTASKTVKGKKRDAEAELLRMLVEAGQTDELPTITDPAITVRQYLAVWLEAKRIELAPLTYLGYAQVFRLHINPKLGHRRLKKLLPTEISAAYARMKLAPSTIRSMHNIFEGALADAGRDGIRTSNPAVAARLPKVPAAKKALPTHRQIAEIIAASTAETAMMVRLLWLTGLRRGELAGLRWVDVDLDAGRLEVRRQVQNVSGKLEVLPLKTETGVRRLRLPASLVAALRRYRAVLLEKRLKTAARPPEDWLFHDADGNPIGADAITGRINHAGRKIGISLTPHLLRHRHATDLHEQGISPKVLQQRLGHADVATTLRIYSHVTEAAEQSAVDAVDRLANSVTIGDQ